MKIKVIGRKRYDFTPEGSNKAIVGARIIGIITQPDIVDDNLEGNDVFTESISDMSAYDAQIGKEYFVIHTMSKVKDKVSGQVYNVAKPAKLTLA